MQLHWGWAVLGALLVAGAVVWWTRPPPVDHASPDDRPGKRRADGSSDAGPTLYRWVDAHGVVNISTEKPRPGVRYTIVHVNPDQNVVPMRRKAGNGE